MELIGEPRVAVCVPAGDVVDTYFAYDYAKLLVRTAHTRPRLKLYPMISTGSLIQMQREQLVDTVLGMTDATHVLWLDSDMRFPGDTLLRLLNHKVPAVCAAYTERKPPFKPVAYLDPANWDTRVWPTEDATGLREIAWAGLGCCLIERHVLEDMSQPRFAVTWVETTAGKGHCGEDMFFFLKMADEVGVKLLLDQDLTKEIAHIGRFEFTPEHAIRAAQQRGESFGESTTVNTPAESRIEGDEVGGPSSN
jgi:hypothetical protein